MSEQSWAGLVADYDTAIARSDTAFAAYDALEPAGSDDTEEERRYEAAFASLLAAEDRLLGTVAPHLTGVALQLRIFAERFHSAELSEPETPGEGRPAGAILRRILSGIEHGQTTTSS